MTPLATDNADDALLGILADDAHAAGTQALARRLGLPVYRAPPRDHGLMLHAGSRGLALIDTAPDGPSPVRVDFADRRLQHRLRQASPRREAVARALGLVGEPGIPVVDATGGLGQDSFVLASLGARVTVLERHPVVFELLYDGWQRALNNPVTVEAAQRLTPIHADAVDWLATQQAPRVIYLDPMYPEQSKGGEVKKGMRSLQRLVGAEDTLETLFEAAWRAAPARLVVKRPRRAPILRSEQRKFFVDGRHTRFDVYMAAEAQRR